MPRRARFASSSALGSSLPPGPPRPPRHRLRAAAWYRRHHRRGPEEQAHGDQPAPLQSPRGPDSVRFFSPAAVTCMRQHCPSARSAAPPMLLRPRACARRFFLDQPARILFVVASSFRVAAAASCALCSFVTHPSRAFAQFYRAMIALASILLLHMMALASILTRHAATSKTARRRQKVPRR